MRSTNDTSSSVRSDCGGRQSRDAEYSPGRPSEYEKKISALTTTVVAYSYEGHRPDVGITDRAETQNKISQCRHAWLSHIDCLPLSVTFLASPSDGYER